MKKIAFKVLRAGLLALTVTLGMMMSAEAAVKAPPATAPCCDNINDTDQDSFE